ncbi:MAG: aminotransferase class V-fold PLP-dependent enzyme, partial [Dehalococcoidia bacterium]
TPLTPLIVGGSQEQEQRAGTENVAGAVGLATALDLAYLEFDARNGALRAMRNQLWREIRERIDRVVLNGPAGMERRLPNNLNLCFAGVEGESILLQLDLEGIAASSGSACTTGSVEPSHVLTALGVDEELAHGAVRLTVGTDNDAEQIERVAQVLPQIIERLRALSPVS